jgi:hypothetical protein
VLIRTLNTLRCVLAARILRLKWDKNLGLARRIAPGTTSLVAHRPRRAPPLALPPCSHLIYHQSCVDPLAAENSLASLASQIPVTDEVVLLDVGATGHPSWLAPFAHHDWSSYVACQASQPEQQSYTFGLNAVMSGLRAPRLVVWRTDYVFPAGLASLYARHLTRARFAAPYHILVGRPEVDSAFVRREASRLAPFDLPFWSERAVLSSLYEYQDPALFAIRRELWDKIGGLNHGLWGYGWQFAEFAARVRAECSDSEIAYFASLPPLHQTHAGSQMHEPGQRRAEVDAGICRFRDFLGGEDAYQSYRLMQVLPPRAPAPPP